MSALVVLGRAGSAEWSRLWSVRSTWIFTVVTAVVVVGFGTILGYDASTSSGPPPGATAWDGGRLAGMFALFGVLALSVVTSTADHGTGGIVPTLQWTPRREVLFAARIGVIVVTTTVLGVVLLAVASLVIWTFVPEVGLPFGEGAETLGGLGYVLGAGAMLAVGLGLALRSTAGALVSVVALLLVLPFVLAQVGYDWAVTTAAHLPGAGALFLIFGEGPSDEMTTTSARVTLAVWAVVAVVAGGLRLLRSDADR